ncbi:MAG: alpha-amylase family glycosyl hydrolase [Bacteroidota bacterium]
MPRFLLALAALALAFAPLTPPASAQDVDVTFRFIPDLTPPPITPVVRAFVPGSFNDWGPNSSGQIQPTAPSLMDFEAPLSEYRYTVSLDVGEDEFYKIHYHRNSTGSDFQWITDPLATDPCTFGTFGDDCRITASDPMAFQPARETDASGQIVAVSVGFFGTRPIDDVQFLVNNSLYREADGITNTGDGIYRLVLPEPVPPGSRFLARAFDDAGFLAETSVGQIPPTVVDAPVPDGIEDGITHTADGTYLVLRAPGKSYVYAAGDFNDWTPGDDDLLFRDTTDPRGTRWWVLVDGLTDGEEYAFTYLIDGTLEVADPYSPLVYYPGEEQHPGGSIGFAVGAFTAGGRDFDWTDDDWTPPAQEDLVIYELLVRDFLADHSFTSLTDTLGYLQGLGINAIELMPVSEFDGDESWGYNPAFHLALDKYYGTPEDFKAFVNEAHNRGIAVILDVVYNHATGQSPLIRLYNSGGFSGPTASNPYANVSARHPFNVFNDLDHESELTKIWLDAANRYWMEEYRVDGYRFDLSKGFTQRQSNDVGQWNAYDQSRVDLLTRMADELWDAHPDAYVILEHLGGQQEENVLARYRRDEGKGMLVWHKMDREYSQSSMGYPTANDFPSTLTNTYPPNIGRPTAGVVTYMESHDEQWTMFRNQAYANANGPYDIQDRLHIALDRQKMMGAFFFTVPGPRMIWQFVELGYGWNPGECLVNGNFPGECTTSDPGRVANKPIRWDYWAEGVQPVRGAYSGGTLTTTSASERAQRRKLYDTWSALINLRNDYEIFSSLDTDVDLRLGRVPDRFIRLDLPDAPAGEPTEAIIFGNHGVAPRTVTLAFDEPTTWYDFFDDTEASFQAGTFTFELLPGEFKVWTDVDVPSPAPGLITVDSDEPPVATSDLAPLRAFPNPATARLGVEVEVAEPGALRVEVLDVLGRHVLTLHDGPVGAGRQRVEADVRALPAGVYLVRSVTAEGAETVRVTVAR